MREYVRRLLSQRFEVEALANGREALDASRQLRPDVIVTDVMMPELDGFGLLHQVRADPSLREIPVIMLSARAGEEARIDGVQAGADDYLIKPFSARELVARVSAHVEMARVHREAMEAVRESEERYRSLTQAITSIVWTTDADGQIVTPQPSWSQYTGQMWEQLRDFGWANALHPDDRQRVWELWKAACACRMLYKSEGWLWHAASNSYRHFEARGVPILNADGSLREWVGTCMDVEDRTQAQEALKEAGRRKDEFLAMLAHELRNPLAPIRNALQIVRLTEGNREAVQSASEMMERQIGQMVRLVDDLLDVSRISRGKIELRKGRVELASVVNHAVESTRPSCQSKGLVFTVTLPPQPMYLNADPTRLAQVVGNLLNNACKFTERGGHIGLTVEREGGQVVIRVRDTGMGIAADELPRIFEMFTQVDTSLERTQSGLGIGLTLVRELVEMHGGTVEAHSAGIGQGSEFVVRLPILVETPEAPPPEPTVSEPTPTTAHRILVVDDNRDSAESLAILLTLTGNETHTAYDCLEAVEAAATFKPDVVLLDIGLPKMNGFEAARKIRQQPWGKKIVLVTVTGWGQEEDRQKSREAGFDGHLVKPVDHAALMKLLAELGAG